MKILILILMVLAVGCKKQPPATADDLSIGDPLLKARYIKQADFKKHKITKKESEDCFERYDGTIKCVAHSDVIRASKMTGTALKEWTDEILLTPESRKSDLD